MNCWIGAYSSLFPNDAGNIFVPWSNSCSGYLSGGEITLVWSVLSMSASQEVSEVSLSLFSWLALLVLPLDSHSIVASTWYPQCISKLLNPLSIGTSCVSAFQWSYRRIGMFGDRVEIVASSVFVWGWVLGKLFCRKASCWLAWEFEKVGEGIQGFFPLWRS